MALRGFKRLPVPVSLRQQQLPLRPMHTEGICHATLASDDGQRTRQASFSLFITNLRLYCTPGSLGWSQTLPE